MLRVFVKNQTENAMLSQEWQIIWSCLKDLFFWMRFLKFNFIIFLLFGCLIAVPLTAKLIDYMNLV